MVNLINDFYVFTKHVLYALRCNLIISWYSKYNNTQNIPLHINVRVALMRVRAGNIVYANPRVLRNFSARPYSCTNQCLLIEHRKFFVVQHICIVIDWDYKNSMSGGGNFRAW